MARFYSLFTDRFSRCYPVLLMVPLTMLLWPMLALAADEKMYAGVTCAPEQTIKFRGGTIRLENDKFTYTDENYTNGASITMVSYVIPSALRSYRLST